MRYMIFTVILAIGFGISAARSAAAADPALNLLLKKGVITQQEHDEALKETGQAAEAPPTKSELGPPAEAAPPAKDAESNSATTGDCTRSSKTSFN